LSTAQQDIDSRVEQKGPEGIKKEMEEREDPDGTIKLIGISVFV
jgi:hypothetical protein